VTGNELSINSTFGNLTYTPSSLSKNEILQNLRSVLDTFNISVNGMNEFELPYLYRILKLHKNPYKHRYIAGSNKCSTKSLSLLSTSILTAVKEKLQTYCATTYTRSCVNQMWILKNSKDLLANLKAQNFFEIDSIKHMTFRLLTLPFLIIN
jgi:hypothetical protein